jgi:eukaryotic-like serine/threonine-protein kinase
MISHYYTLVPDDLDAAWGYMTPDYQTNHAGGPTGYHDFWDQIQSVSASSIAAQPPSTVTATITYHYKNGKTVVEPTSYGLVLSDGIWKIASSSVLSSTTE